MNRYSRMCFFILGICITLVFAVVYNKDEGGGYQIIGAENGIQLFDLKTKSIYYHVETEGLWHRVDSQGYNTTAKELPK